MSPELATDGVAQGRLRHKLAELFDMQRLLSGSARLLPLGLRCEQAVSSGIVKAPSNFTTRGYAAVATDSSDRQHGWQLGAAAAVALATAGLGSWLLLDPQTSHCEEVQLASAGQTKASLTASWYCSL